MSNVVHINVEIEIKNETVIDEQKVIHEFEEGIPSKQIAINPSLKDSEIVTPIIDCKANQNLSQ